MEGADIPSLAQSEPWDMYVVDGVMSDVNEGDWIVIQPGEFAVSDTSNASICTYEGVALQIPGAESLPKPRGEAA